MDAVILAGLLPGLGELAPGALDAMSSSADAPLSEGSDSLIGPRPPARGDARLQAHAGADPKVAGWGRARGNPS